MAYQSPRRRGARARTPRVTALALTGILGLTLAPSAGLAAPVEVSEPGFTSSFEASDPTLTPSAPYGDELSNVTGQAFRDGSLLPLVAQVSASGDNPPSEVADSLKDGQPSTKWLARSTTGWAQYRLSEAAAVTSYTLTSANDSPERDPKDFTLEGSDDGAAWTVLDTRTNQAWKTDKENRLVTKEFTLPARTAEYDYYRLNITANNGADLIQLADWELIDSERTSAPSPMTTVVDKGPTASETAKTGVGFTGLAALHYQGRQITAGAATATNELFSTDVEVTRGMQLSYKVFPVLDSDITYSATHVAVDLVMDDGQRLSTSDATDAYGFGANAAAQGEADILWPDQWNSVTVDLSAFAGRTVKEILLQYSNPDAPAGTAFTGWVDDVTLDQAPERDTSDGLVSYVDTRRGTNSTGGYSRGNNLPATAWPNGFNFITPMTNADTYGTVYHYQRTNNSENKPGLNGIGFSHQPSIWMGDRNQLAVMPAAGDQPTSNLNDRRLTFSHDNEVARPDIYSVDFDNGIRTEVTPTDHGAVYRFTFAGDKGSVLVDQLVDSSKLSVSADGTVSGWVDGGSGWPGRSRMFIHGVFDTTPTAAGNTPQGNRSTARYAAFDTGSDKTVELRIASSFISADQARKNYDLELDGLSFEKAHEAATAAWNDRLGVITDVEGATDVQLVNLYSGLYRLNLYPNSQFENVGTAASPSYAYASPVAATTGSATDTATNAQVKPGKIYVNNGFWDTYRTAWPAIAMLYPDLSEELVDGFVQQYRDSGWIARWSSPGYADLMTGTSSDVAFAEAYVDGTLSNETALEAYDAAVKNATALPASNAVGRKGLETSIFLGFTPETTHQSASWGLEGFINDFGIAEMAKKLAEDPETPADRVDQLKDEAEYFEARSKHYVEMYNPEAGVFTARNADGTWPDGADFDKKAWGGAFTEASGWTFAFHAPFDVDGLAALYGGRQGLVDELHEFLTTQERADHSGIHEAREARDVRLGMLGMSNQVAHHIPYVLAEAGDPSGAQELIRDITQRLFAGSDIGQGYPGDEDNGEMSAWYIYSALGFYPLEVGSGNYTIGSPLFDSATVHMGDKTLKVTAQGASEGKVYVAGVTANGKEITDTTFDGALIRNGGTLDFTMSDTPSTWGAKDMTEKLEVPQTLVDATKPGFGGLVAEDGTNVSKLVDDSMTSSVVFGSDSASLTWKSASGPVAVHQYTLTSTKDTGAAAPSSWTLQGSLDGENWTTLDEREGQTFPFGTQTRPFSVGGDPAAYTSFRLVVHSAAGSRVGLAEVELFAHAADASGLSVTSAGQQKAVLGQEFSGTLATVVGAGTSASDYTVLVSQGDGTEPTEGRLTANGLGGWAVSAPHTFTRAGTYTVTVTVTDGSGGAASATTDVVVSRDSTLQGSFNNTCIADASHAASCDGQASGYKRDDLATSGFKQGETISVTGTDLTFDLPAVEPGQPDNVTGEGQTIALDLGTGATRISVIGTATESGKDLTGTLTFSDGTTQTIPLQFGDWVGAAKNPAYGNVVVGLSNGRLIGTTPESSIKVSAVFATTPVALDKDESGAPKTVVSLTLPQEEGSLVAKGRIHVFAIASDGDRTQDQSLTVIPAEDVTTTVGTEFSGTLADVEGGRAGADLTATVNWGDGTAVVDSDVDDNTVGGSHTYAKAGTYKVTVTVDDGVKSASAQVSVTVDEQDVVYAPTLSVTGDAVLPGAGVQVVGEGFAPGESVAVTFGGDTTSVEADGDGGFTTEVTVPEDATPGVLAISAVGEVSQVEATASVTVGAPVPGPAATTLDMKAPDGKILVDQSFGLTATVSPAEAAGTVRFLEGDVQIGEATVSGGVAVADVRLATSGDHEIHAVFVPDAPDSFSGSTSDSVTITVGSVPVGEAGLVLSHSSRAPGEVLGITGRGFTAGEKVVLTLGSDPITLTTVTTDDNGGFSVTVTVPATATAGDHTVVGVGQDSGLRASAPLSVTEQGAPSEPGNGSEPGNQGHGGGLAITGAWGLGLVSLAAAVLLVTGVGMKVTRRRRAGVEAPAHREE